MGTTQSKQIPKINKTQFQVSCTKAKIHLELMRDRKNAQIIKGQKQLVNKLKSQNRNKVQQQLLAERVTNGLKYAQACNILASYASTLKSQSNYISQNIANDQKMQPWLIYIYSLQFGAQHMGLSSLQQYRHVIRSLYSVQQMNIHCNKQIIQLLNPTPTAQQINIYVIEMSERNQIPLEQINIVGHKFTKQWDAIPVELDQNILNVRKSIGQEQNGQGFSHGHGQRYGNNQGGQGFGKQGGQGFGNNQGGQGFGNNQSGQGFSNQGGQEFNNNNQGYQGFGGGNNPYDQKPLDNDGPNPYKGLSHINSGPTVYQPQDFTPQHNNTKPRQFSSFEQMLKSNQQNNFKLPIYPQVNPKQFKGNEYKPIHNPFTHPQQQKDHNSPSLSQIMRDFEKKQ